MKKLFVMRPLAMVTAAGLLVLASCEDRLNLTVADQQSVQNEAATDGYFEDADDMASLAVAADNATLNGRQELGARPGVKPNDLRFSCATVTFEAASDNTKDVPHGFITIDFGSGCKDARGNERKGKIRVEFKGRRFLPNSSKITTFDNYSINDVKIEGTRTVTNVTGSTEENPKFMIVVAGGKATWPDGLTATREVNRMREWVRTNTPATDQWVVSGVSGKLAASGTNRNGRTYQVTITKPMVYKRECAISDRVFMAVEGTKEMIVDGKKIVIDYGSGECDKLVTITVDGVTREIEVRGDI
jgi:hypothetical protein